MRLESPKQTVISEQLRPFIRIKIKGNDNYTTDTVAKTLDIAIKTGNIVAKTLDTATKTVNTVAKILDIAIKTVNIVAKTPDIATKTVNTMAKTLVSIIKTVVAIQIHNFGFSREIGIDFALKCGGPIRNSKSPIRNYSNEWNCTNSEI